MLPTTYEQIFEEALRRKMARRRSPRSRWYPIECEHGYDCCPICDGAQTPHC